MYPEERIVQDLPYELRLAYIAYCARRCLDEARRHAVARAQLEQLPMLHEALEMLWTRAEGGSAPEDARVRAILEHFETYEADGPDRESVVYRFDIALIQAARVLKSGLDCLRHPDRAEDVEYVASAIEGPAQTVDLVYADGDEAQASEVEHIGVALERLRESAARPFDRRFFDGLEDWTRGALAPRYAAGRLTGSAPDDDA